MYDVTAAATEDAGGWVQGCVVLTGCCGCERDGSVFVTVPSDNCTIRQRHRPSGQQDARCSMLRSTHSLLLCSIMAYHLHPVAGIWIQLGVRMTGWIARVARLALVAHLWCTQLSNARCMVSA